MTGESSRKRKRNVVRGSRSFRGRLVMATLAKRKLVISGIREESEAPGVTTAEANFVRLMDKLTTGSKIEINETGTVLTYEPGLLSGGSLEHTCSPTKGVGWFLEAVLPLAPFCSGGLRLALRGVTSGGRTWRSADALKSTVENVMVQAFGVKEAEVRIERRQAGGKEISEDPGRVVLTCRPPQKHLENISLVDEGLVKNVRGIAFCTRVSPALANRCVSAARSQLNQLVSDVRITTDASSRRHCADAPGFGIVLVAETTSEAKISVDLDASWAIDDASPESLGEKAALCLCAELEKRAVFDTASVPLVLTLMALGPDHVSVAKLPSPLSQPAIDRLNLIKSFLGVTFKLDQLTDEPGIKAICRGAHLANLARTVT